jgi:HAD superfamily hydrolase (TIGR01509 family)
VAYSREAFDATFGMPSRDIIRCLWGDDVDDERVRQLDDRKEAAYRDLVRGMVPLTIGVREVLATLAEANLVLAVATSGPPENVDLVLDETGLRDCFRAVVHGFDVKHGKPAPDPYAEAARRAELSPGRCVVVEDAPVGIQSGLAAGMKVIGFEGTHPRAKLVEAGAHRVVGELKEITPGLVRDLLDGGV